MGWFRRGSLLGADLTDWQFDAFAWLLRHTGGMSAFAQRRLITPTPRDFPQRGLQGHALAEALFEQVKAHTGMSAWPCELRPQAADPDIHIAPTLLIQGAPQSPAGTFRRAEEGVVITYKSTGLGDPESLVATLAHELAHYRTADFPEPPPGGWELWEPATDLAAVFFGFGLFLTNSHFRFSQHMNQDSMGWRTTRHGYLSEAELLHAHAIFCTLQGLPPKDTLRHLKPALRGLCKRLFREAAACTEAMDRLRAITSAPVVADDAPMQTHAAQAARSD